MRKWIAAATAIALAAGIFIHSASADKATRAEVERVVGLYFKGAETAEASYFEECWDTEHGRFRTEPVFW